MNLETQTVVEHVTSKIDCDDAEGAQLKGKDQSNAV